MTDVKEVPGMALEGTGMRLYTGCIVDGYRFRAYVPTTIFDPLVARLRVYKTHNKSKQFPDSPEELVTMGTVRLRSLPRWNVPYQCLELSTRDERAVRKALGELEKKVSK